MMNDEYLYSRMRLLYSGLPLSMVTDVFNSRLWLWKEKTSGIWTTAA